MTVAGWTIAILIVMLTVIAFLARGSFILFLHTLPLPAPVRQGLRFVPPAVFAALVAPELLYSGGGLIHLSPGNEKLMAGLGAGIVAWRTRNTLATVVVGMVILHLVRYLRP